GPDLAGPALGGAFGDDRVRATAPALSPLRHPDGAPRVCRPEGAGHAPAAAVDWPRLSVDAHESCRGAPRGELGRRAPGRTRVLAPMGRAAAEAAPPLSRPR